MRYWAYVDNEVRGPFEKDKLLALPGFGEASLICPETPAAGETAAWKAAAVYPEIAALLAKPPEQAPAPAPAPARAAESPLAMTMRGTLISDPILNEPVLRPAAAAPAPVKAAAFQPEPKPAAASPAPADAGLREKLDQMTTMLVSLGNAQSRLLEKLEGVERSVSEMKSLLFPGLQKKE